jgi:hypothetical protein
MLSRAILLKRILTEKEQRSACFQIRIRSTEIESGRFVPVLEFQGFRPIS